MYATTIICKYFALADIICAAHSKIALEWAKLRIKSPDRHSIERMLSPSGGYDWR